ncbi:MAG: hypothetical protein V3R90_08700 [Limibaculum sp.]
MGRCAAAWIRVRAKGFVLSIYRVPVTTDTYAASYSQVLFDKSVSTLTRVKHLT